MSSAGGHRAGSGRKRIYDSSAAKRKVWDRGHKRIWLDAIIYSSWVSAKLKCGFNADSKFASHLLSLEQRLRENNFKFFARAGPRTDIDDTPLGKRRRVDHKDVLEGPILTSTPAKAALISKKHLPANVSPLRVTGTPNESMQVDITGLSEAGDVKFIGDSSFKIIDGSVVVSRSDSISSSSSE